MIRKSQKQIRNKTFTELLNVQFILGHNIVRYKIEMHLLKISEVKLVFPMYILENDIISRTEKKLLSKLRYFHIFFMHCH